MQFWLPSMELANLPLLRLRRKQINELQEHKQKFVDLGLGSSCQAKTMKLGKYEELEKSLYMYGSDRSVNWELL